MARNSQKNPTPEIIPAGRRPERFARECGISKPTLDRLQRILPAELRPRSLKLGKGRSSPRIYVEDPRHWLERMAAAQHATHAA